MSARGRGSPVRAVLFDLDGTLLDTAPDMVGAMNALLAEECLPPVRFDTARAQVSHGSNGLMRIAFPGIEGEAFERLRDRFLALYRARLVDETDLFPGGAELLEYLEGAALPWGVVTNKPGWLAEPLLAELGLAARMACLVSGDTLPMRKPSPEPLLHAAGAIGVPPAECVYVGDALRDVEAARAAGMRAVVASFGYVSAADEHLLWPAEAWIDSPAALVRWLEGT
ncbi:MAG: N-acetylmuramic acid 6-phosphate phosphatase [Steroidobacteraceae bacterium]|nr:N-acetylmuramic acid 6-phosphate phosphatase [Steroidobacteraceae bacterium]